MTRETDPAAAPPSAPSMPESPMRRVVSIQHLRGLAALAVVVFHILEASRFKFTVGSAGVDVFFVISGFIMWSLSDGRTISPGPFLLKRAARVAPPYWIVTLVAFVGATLKPNLLWGVVPDPGGLALSLAFIPFRNAEGQPFPVLIQGWTLNYEMAFYVLFALVLATRRRLLVLTAAMGGLVALHGLAPPGVPPAGVYTDPLILEFLAGAALGALHRRGRLPGARLSAALATAGALGFALSQAVGYHPDALRPLVWGGPAVLIVAGALGLERAGRIPDLPALQALGDSSYSLYLVHPLVLGAAARLVRGPFPLYAVVATVGSLAVAWGFYRAVEHPLHLWVARWPPRPAPGVRASRRAA